MKVSCIFTETLRDLRFGVRRIRHQGGQDSGKTVNILASLATLAAEEDGSDGIIPVTTVTSMSMPHLKGGALRDFEMYVYPEFKSSIRKYHKTDHLFSFKSGHVVEFKVFETEMDARGPKRKRLFVNEANKFEWIKFFHLDSRSSQTIYDYNPSIRFWAHEEHDNDGETKLYISDHRNNPFLPERRHIEIENFYQANAPIYGDEGQIIGYKEKGSKELFKVYARGLTGNVMGVIFPYWEVIDEGDFPKDEDWIYSVDFGYTNDPTAMVKICLIGNTLFIKELAYETGMSPIAIKQVLLGNGYKESMPLYCEHDPDMIRILRNLGIAAFPARKGQGSINAGIELINTYDVRYPHTSRNLHRERGMYIWEVDKNTGKPTNMPVDLNNHLMDACRYGIFTKFLRAQLK